MLANQNKLHQQPSPTNEEKFNNTDVYDKKIEEKNNPFNDYNTNNSKESILNDDDIKEDIVIDETNNDHLEGILDKDKSESLHNYTSSQTFGYDNSVTSYNIDLYDYVEPIDKN